MRGVARIIGAACALALFGFAADGADAERPQHMARAGNIQREVRRDVRRAPQRDLVLMLGQTLWSIARSHGCSVAELARANGITPETTLRPGTRLVLPSGSASAARATAASESARGRSTRKSGVVQARLHRIATNERVSLVLTDPRGSVRPQAATQLARFLRPRHSKKQKRPPARLVSLLAEVSKHYEGRTISVISGYRLPGGYTSKESRHTKGHAIDLRVDGVPLRKLCDYLRTFRDVGVGLYPNSGFVHLDVRERSAYWVDLSSPGRRPSYLDREQRDHFDGKNKDAGLVELGRAVAAAVGSDGEGEGEGEGAPALPQ